MYPFAYACITPHGGEIVPELAGDNPERMQETRKSMEVLGDRMKAAYPDAIIVITPHGTRINGQFSVTECETVSGFWQENNLTYHMERKIDREIAGSIVASAKETGLPVGGLNFGTASGPLSSLPLDWGAIVPLRFMPAVPVVIITPSREVSLDKNLELGKILRRVARESNKRIGLIASCDWSHTHNPDGPYGFHHAAKELDEKVIGLVKSNQLEEMADFDSKLIEDAKPDGIWQTLILAGAIPYEERKVTFLSYEAPTYFGLLCAGYEKE
ncbi:extradiol ring-cleavage dioxygenase [Pseudalkalibacillus caeni]|uniref:Extradiol ring-cleavage dioxygenase n=1 Tax=Exobacillus caeni TaxID=2574798 RepID=A0A5R9EV36_9BACL|nr:extradiol ring-cleavage dioxygenase [Pseudalkalibacillus caeni]TLS35082.1 extradiol ring-cleavage dioxygenase [Pseudalkalibacillus caeni]